MLLSIKNFTLRHLIIVVIIANFISCKCEKKGTGEIKQATLSLEITPVQLNPDNTITTVTFELDEPGKQADLSKVCLRASIIKQEGGTDSKIRFNDATDNLQELPEIDHPLTHFTSLTTLDDSNPSLSINLEFIANKDITSLIYKIEAIDSEGTSIGSDLVEYKAGEMLPTLSLLGASNLQGNQKDINLNIHNTSNKPVAANELKLLITRTKGTEATIVGAIPTANPDAYEIAISEEILAAQILSKTLLIDPKNDKKANFDIQLLQGETKGSTVHITWKEDNELELAITYEAGSRILTYTIINPGTEEFKNAKLEYICKTADIQLGGISLEKDEINAISLGDLKANEKLENQNLGEINFGTNTIADFVFKVVYEGGSTEEENITCRASNVQLSIISDGERIVFQDQKPYTIQLANKGDQIDTAKVTVRFINQKNIAFKLGGLEVATTSDIILKDIIQKDELAEHENISFDIIQNKGFTPDVYGANLMLELLDGTDTSLSQVELTWLNQSKIDTELKPLIKELESFIEDFEVINKKFTASTDENNNLELLKNLFRINMKVTGLLDNLTNIHIYKAHDSLQLYITKKIQEVSDKKFNEVILSHLDKDYKEGVVYMSNQVKIVIAEIEEDPKQQEQLRDTLNERLANMDKWLNYTIELCNQYNTIESQIILQEAQKIAQETKKAAEKINTTTITEAMIEYANKNDMPNVASVLNSLRNKENVDVNQLHTSKKYELTPLHEVVRSIIDKTTTSSKEDIERVRAIIGVLLDNRADIITPGNSASFDKPQNVLEDLIKKIEEIQYQPYSIIFKFLLEEAIKRDFTGVLTKTYDRGYSLLHMAVIAHSNEVDLTEQIKTLIEKTPSDIHEQNVLGYTPLHLASQFGSAEIIKLLVDNGADITIKGTDGKLPYDLVDNNSSEEIKKMLNPNLKAK